MKASLNTSMCASQTIRIAPAPNTGETNKGSKTAKNFRKVSNNPALPDIWNVSFKTSVINAIKTFFSSNKIMNIFNFSKKEAASHTLDHYLASVQQYDSASVQKCGLTALQQINGFNKHNCQAGLSALAKLPPSDEVDEKATKIMEILKIIARNEDFLATI